MLLQRLWCDSFTLFLVLVSLVVIRNNNVPCTKCAETVVDRYDDDIVKCSKYITFVKVTKSYIQENEATIDKCYFVTLKRHFLVQNRVIWRIKHKNRSNGLTCRWVQEPKTKKWSKFRTGGVYVSLIWGAKTPGRIEPNFLVVGVHDVITPLRFGDDRFGGFWLTEGQSLPFPIHFEGRPYNTHTIVWGVI